MAQLNVNEAQRKAMLEWMGEVDPDDFDYEEWLDGLFAAANSIPEGAPVGTIARQPDGAWIGVRREDYWAYRNLVGLPHDVAELSGGPSVAESWPVIYDPTKPEPKVYPYQEGDTTVIGPECFAVPDKRAIAWQGVWYREIPAAQQEPDGPDLLAHKFSDAGIPVPSWANSVELKVEAPDPAQQILGQEPVTETYSTEEAAEILGVDLTAHQEPCKSYNGPIVGYGKVVRRTRTPRVLPTLDCEEAQDGTVWTDSLGVLEWHYRFRGVWERFAAHSSRAWAPLRALNHLKLHGPYTEVLGDPS